MQRSLVPGPGRATLLAAVLLTGRRALLALVLPLAACGCLFPVRHLPASCDVPAGGAELPNYCSSQLALYVAIGGGEPEEFLLDTGSTSFLIHPATAEDLGLSCGAHLPWRVHGADESRWEWRQCSRVDLLSLDAGIVLRDVPCAVAFPPDGYSGVLGNGVLEHVSIEIAADRRTVRIASAPIERREGDIPIRLRRGLPWIALEIAGERFDAILDTGFDNALRLPPRWRSSPAVRESTYTRADASSVSRLETDLAIGALRISNVPVQFGPRDVLVGLELFAGRVVTIDLRSRTLRVGAMEKSLSSPKGESAAPTVSETPVGGR